MLVFYKTKFDLDKFLEKKKSEGYKILFKKRLDTLNPKSVWVAKLEYKQR